MEVLNMFRLGASGTSLSASCCTAVEAGLHALFTTSAHAGRRE